MYKSDGIDVPEGKSRSRTVWTILEPGAPLKDLTQTFTHPLTHLFPALFLL